MYSPAFLIRLLLTFSVFIFFNACDKPDDASDNKEYLVKEIKYDYSDRSIYYDYSDAWQLTRRTEFSLIDRNLLGYTKNDFTYNSAGLVTEIKVTRGTPGENYFETQELRYNANSRLEAVKALNKETATLHSWDVYEYNGKQITQKHQENSIIAFIRTYTLDDKGNIIKAVIDYDDPGKPDYVEEWLDYDDKQNLLGPSAGDVVSKNNFRKYIKQVYNQPAEESRFSYSYKNGKYVEEVVKTGAGAWKAIVTWVAKE
jgi:hypothetical protein